MKAEKLAEKFLENTNEREAIFILLKDLMVDGENLIHLRNARRDSAIISIMKEQSQKWKAVCRIVNEKENILNPDGFEMYIKKNIGVTI